MSDYQEPIIRRGTKIAVPGFSDPATVLAILHDGVAMEIGTSTFTVPLKILENVVDKATKGKGKGQESFV